MKLIVIMIFGLLCVIVIIFVCLEYVTLRTPNIAQRTKQAKSERIVATIQDLQDWLTKLYDQGKFNGTILYIREDKIIFHRNIGFTDQQSDRRISNDTAFNLASVSKHITAYAVLMLAFAKKLWGT